MHRRNEAQELHRFCLYIMYENRTVHIIVNVFVSRAMMKTATSARAIKTIVDEVDTTSSIGNLESC